MSASTTADTTDGYVFPLADEADMCAANPHRIAATLTDCDPVCADNLRRAATRPRASLAADGHPVTPVCP